LVTVYRSMDADAKENCDEILGVLQDAGIEAVLLDDSAPSVPEGVYEVRVPAASAAAADELITEFDFEEEVKDADPSSDLNLETVANGLSEMEANSMKSFLESNGIAAVLVGDAVLPNLTFDIRVARDQLELARQLLVEAQKAELESEPGA
jgi:type III secretory pathway lipoprotein EscJ